MSRQVSKETGARRNKCLILILLLVLIAGGTAALVLQRKNSHPVQKPDDSDIQQTQEQLDREEALRLATAVSDEETFRQLLLLEEELEINLTEDITVVESLIVNGTKTVYGTSVITAEKQQFVELNVFEVSKGASLKIDGVQLLGNGMANGVWVREGAELEFLSGNIRYMSYGIQVDGNATVENITVQTPGRAAIYVTETGNAVVNGGDYLNSGVTAMLNKGTLELHGGHISGIAGYGITNYGYMVTKYEGSEKDGYIEIRDAMASALYSSATQDCTFENLRIVGGKTNSVYINGSVKDAGVTRFADCRFENAGGNCMSIDGTVEMYNVTIADPVERGMYVRTDAKISMANCRLENTGKSAVQIEKNATVKVNNVSIVGTVNGHAVIANGGNIQGTLLKINDSNRTALQAIKSGDVGGTMNLTKLTIEGTKVNNLDIREDCKVTLTDSTLGKSERTNVIAKDGAVITLNHVKVNGTTSDDVASISVGLKSTVKISDVTIDSPAGPAVFVSGGTINGQTLTIRNTGKSAIRVLKSGEVGGIMNLSNVTITGTQVNNLDVREKCTATLTDAVLGESVRTNVVAYSDAILSLNNVKINGASAKEVAGLSVERGATVKVNNVSVNHTAGKGVLVSGGTLNGKTLNIDNSGTTAIQVTKSKEVVGTVNLSDVSITGSKVNNLDVRGGSMTTLTDAVLGESVRTNVVVYEDSTLSLDNVKLQGTSSADVGGVVAEKGSSVQINNVSIDNTAGTSVIVNGGNISGKKLTIHKSGVSGMKVVKSGNFSGTVKLSNVTMTGTKVNNLDVRENCAVTLTDSVLGKSVRTNVYAKEGSKITFNGVVVSGTTSVDPPALLVGKGSVVELQGDTKITGGGSKSRGVDVYGILIMKDGCICDNNTTTDGAGVYVYETGLFTMKGGTIQGNSTTKTGGGIYVQGTFKASGGEFYNNTSVSGGAVRIVAGISTIENTSFENNSAVNTAGAIRADKGVTLVLKQDAFCNNTAGGNGGAVNFLGGTLTATDCIFTGNNATAGTGGGALAINDGAKATLNLNRTDTIGFYRNSAPNGGAVYCNNATEIFNGYSYQENATTGRAGAVYVGSTAKVTMNDVVICNNTSGSDGGAIYLLKGGNLTLESETNDFTDSKFDGNISKGKGGAIYAAGGELKIGTEKYGYLFCDNSSKTSAGAMYLESEVKVTVANSRVEGNINGGSGGAVYTETRDGVFQQTEFLNNVAATLGGAIHCTNKSKLKVINCIFDGNIAGAGTSENRDGSACTNQEGGGAVSITGGSTIVFSIDSGKGEFKNNKTIGVKQKGGGAIYTNNATVSVDGYAFRDNASVNSGGAIYVNSAGDPMTVANVVFDGNTEGVTYANGVVSGGKGNAICTDKTLKLDNCTFAENDVVKLNGAKGTAEVSNTIKGAYFVYTQNVAGLTIGEKGLAADSSIAIIPIYTPETKVVVGTENVLTNAIEKITVIQPENAGGVWSLKKDGTLIYSIPINAADLAQTIQNALNGSTICISGNVTVSEKITIDKMVILKTVGTENVTLTRGAETAMYQVAENGNLRIDGNITLDGNGSNVTGTESLIINSGVLTMGSGVTIKNCNIGTGNGGALQNNDSATAYFKGVKFTDNKAKLGGALHITNGSVSMIDCVISNNSSLSHGGAVYMADGTLMLNSTTAEQSDSKFEKNVSGTSSQGLGGAIYASKGNLYIGYDGDDATTEYGYLFDTNTSNYHGGAISLNADSVVVICSSEFQGNVSGNGKAGGAINSYSNSLNVENSTFKENTSAAGGGGIMISGSKNTDIKNCVFEKNKSVAAGQAGGAVTVENATVTVTECTFIENESANSSRGGGAVYVKYGTLRITDSVFKDNKIKSGAKGGGAIYILGDSAKQSEVSVLGNTSFSGNAQVDMYIENSSKLTLDMDTSIVYTTNVAN